MKVRFLLSVWMCGLLFCGVGPGRAYSQAMTGLLSLDDAIAGAAAAVEVNVQRNTEIAIAKIDAPFSDLSDFLNEELTDRFVSDRKYKVLARGQSLERVDAEHQFQMSGMVSDESAVGIGHYLGAKVVITGTFDRFANFSQFRLRAIDVETARLLATYSARLNNADSVLADVTAPLQSVKAAPVTEDALAALNRGKDLYAEGGLDEAIREFGRAIAINRELSEGYLFRGTVYFYKGMYDRAIADYNTVLRINPNDTAALCNRGVAYADQGNFGRAIADYNAVLRINPNDANILYNCGILYANKGEYDRAIADYTAALRINPNFAAASTNRGVAYYQKGDIDQAIADYTVSLKINPNDAQALCYRGIMYGGKGDLDRAAEDFTAALRIDPNLAAAREGLNMVRQQRGR